MKKTLFIIPLFFFFSQTYSMVVDKEEDSPEKQQLNEIATLIQIRGKILLASTWCTRELNPQSFMGGYHQKGHWSYDEHSESCTHQKALSALLPIGTRAVCLSHPHLQLEQLVGWATLQVTLKAVDPEAAKTHANNFKLLIECAATHKERPYYLK